MAKWGEGDPRWIVEERPDATNVNNWHWSEKNANRWSQGKLQELLMDLKVEGEKGTAQIKEVSKCEGEAVVNNRKGKLIFFYDWQLDLKWEAKGNENDSKLKCKGKINIPNLSEENAVDEIDVEPTVEESSDFAYTMKQLMYEKGRKLIREKIAEYISSLKEEYSQGLILPKKEETEAKVIKPAASKAPVKLSSQSQLSGAVKNMNIDTMSFTSRQNLFCPINEAYKCFTEQRMVEAFTRGPVKMEAKPRGKFELFNGNIFGEFIELEENLKVKQYWQNKSWPSGVRSIVELTFDEEPEGTSIVLKHSGIPSSELDATKQGWEQYYWNPIKATFGFGSFLTDVL
ncbi:activator of 90 kDa heat shock protein ATPase homolog 1 [Neocloeon triangulifer]|uniref:activator of 90 kDa heat shock protein ATPase homolog 1 n=1 Tax=Neocloeon triangulifer TaxID=2078957 RepID=UPI00286F462D|nr:activator of 90 kDa heat shock protein ATPase homolog 1 [Neocloeon triangulifer]